MFDVSIKTNGATYSPMKFESEENAKRKFYEKIILYYVAGYGPIEFETESGSILELEDDGEAFECLESEDATEEFLEYINNDNSESEVNDDMAYIEYENGTFLEIKL